MAKSLFSRGACVRAKKWSGQEFFGVLEYTYDDGSFCVLEVSSGKRFNVKARELQLANEEEEKDIKKVFKEGKFKLHEKADAVSYAKGITASTPKKETKEIDEDEFNILTEGIEEEELPTIEDEID